MTTKPSPPVPADRVPEGPPPAPPPPPSSSLPFVAGVTGGSNEPLPPTPEPPGAVEV